jgi:hypothetical protein
MTYTNYDSWKLSNPIDDGHYTEDTKPRIEEPIYFKFKTPYDARWLYGMITTSGYEIRVWDFGGIRTIDVDELEPYTEEVQDEINRIKFHYTHFEYIAMQEFYAEFEQAHTKILKVVQDETGN